MPELRSGTLESAFACTGFPLMARNLSAGSLGVGLRGLAAECNKRLHGSQRAAFARVLARHASWEEFSVRASLKPLADSLLPFVAMASLRPRLANTMFAITFVLSPGAAGEHDVRNHLRLFSRVPGRCPGL